MHFNILFIRRNTMKKLFFTLLIIAAAINYAYALENPRKALVASIAHADLEGATKALKKIDDMTQVEQHKYLRMADQILERPLHSEIGIELLKAAGFGYVTYLCIAPTLFCYMLTYCSIEDAANKNKYNTTLESMLLFVAASAVSTGITCFAGLKTATYLRCAWRKPEERLEIILLIKDAIAEHQVI